MKLMLIAGARPNFMKVAPLVWAIEKHNALPSSTPIEYSLVHTGQHYDEKMSEVFFRELQIPTPDINLGVGSGSHAEQTAKVMLQFEPVLMQKQPDWVVVVGDVNSTVACSLVAAKLGVRIAHVEAGLRSFDRTMPEEINRLVTDAIADLLLTPSKDADENLRREGIAEHKIRLVGNVMIDSVIRNLERARASEILGRLGLQPGEFVYVTLHRPSNVDEPAVLEEIMAQLVEVSEFMRVVFPVHPRTAARLDALQLRRAKNSRIQWIEPVGYHDSLCLTESARIVVTDSGGLQEESTFFRTPCLTLRPNTERPITITEGSNRLTSPERLKADVEKASKDSDRIGSVPPCWDGNSAVRILEALLDQTMPLVGPSVSSVMIA